MESLAEVWRAVPERDGYEVSSLGRVRSIDRKVWRKDRSGVFRFFHWKGRLLKPINHRGYLVVKIGGKNRPYGIHQVVAWAFIGPQEPGMVVDHINTNKHDNRPENLEYVTNPENVRRQYATGLLSNVGETNGRAVLTREQVMEIRASKEKRSVLAARYGVKPGYITNLRCGRNWKALEAPAA